MIKPHIYLTCLALALAGCNSSSSSDPDTTDNSGSDDTSNNDSNGSGTAGKTPAEVFRFSSALDYVQSYSGADHWAQPVASLYTGNPEDQQQRLMMDTALLGNALMAVPYHITDSLFDHLGTEPANLIDFMDQSACPSGPLELSNQSGSETFGPACVQASKGDNAEITFNGNLHWDQADTDYELTYEFQDLAIEWRGEDFTLNGAGALSEELSWLLLAMDVRHNATGTTYRYWVRHRFGLSTSQPQIDLVAFHPDLGAMAQLAEQAFNNNKTCTDGGFTDHSSLLLNNDRAQEAAVEMYYEFVACDVYRIGADNGADADGNAVPPELHPAYASLGIDVGLAQLAWRNSGSHYQLEQSNPGETLLTPTQVSLAKLGTQGDSDDYNQYHLALTFDLDDLPGSIATENDVLAASLRLHQLNEGNPYSFVRASQEEWTGVPENEFTPDDPIINLSGTNTLNGSQPWLWGNAADWVKLALNESRTELQVVVGVETMLGFNEGEAFSEVCLNSSSECAESLQPTLEVIY